MITSLFFTVTMTLKRMTGQTQAAETGSTLDKLDLPHLWCTSLQRGIQWVETK
jgi:hypothetical protein